MEYQTLLEAIRNCKECRERFDHEPRPVVLGSLNAKIMHISQAPSRHVHETGYPFNDQSGETLRHEWYHIDDEDFYDADNFYITSIGKCFPGKQKSGGDKKPPKICSQLWLNKELDHVGNSLYLIVGRDASDYFFKNEPFIDIVMNDQTIRGKPAFVLPHPSPLNIKWFKDHPEFFNDRLPKIRAYIHALLY